MFKKTIIVSILALTVLIWGTTIVSAQSANAASGSAKTATASDNGVRVKTDEEAQVERIRQATSASQTFTKLSDSERAQALQELRAMNESQRCERLQTNIEQRLQFYEASYARHLAKYEQIATNIDKAVQRLEELGYDVANLKVNLELLRNMVAEMRTTRSRLVTNFGSAAGLACDTANREGYQSAVNSVQASVESLKEKAEEILDFITTEIRNDLNNAKDSAPASS